MSTERERESPWSEAAALVRSLTDSLRHTYTLRARVRRDSGVTARNEPLQVLCSRVELAVQAIPDDCWQMLLSNSVGGEELQRITRQLLNKGRDRERPFGPTSEAKKGVSHE